MYSPISDGEILSKIKSALGVDKFSAFWARDILFGSTLPLFLHRVDAECEGTQKSVVVVFLNAWSKMMADLVSVYVTVLL